MDAEPILTHVLEQVQELAGASTLPWARTEHPWLAPARAPDEMGRLGPIASSDRSAPAAWGWFTRAKTRTCAARWRSR